MTIKETLFPKAAGPTTLPTTSPSSPERPLARLEDLLARHSGVTTATEQVEVLQKNFDAQMGQIDQRQRQLEDLQRLVASAQQQVRVDRAAVEADRKKLEAEQKETARLAGDQGFQDSLSLYNTMTPKQVKAVFVSMDDGTVVNYLRAMQPRTAAKIVKEFKTPEEVDRVRKLLDRMRQDSPATNPTKEN